MSILLLQVDTWVLEIKNHGEGFQVALVKNTEEPPVTYYVRLDREQSKSLREFMKSA